MTASFLVVNNSSFPLQTSSSAATASTSHVSPPLLPRPRPASKRQRKRPSAESEAKANPPLMEREKITHNDNDNGANNSRRDVTETLDHDPVTNAYSENGEGKDAPSNKRIKV